MSEERRPKPRKGNSGLDPMSDSSKPADPGHVMTTAIRYPEQQHGQSSSRTAGRFGRDVRSTPHPLDDMGDTRTVQVQQMREEKRSGYRVDCQAVAKAILERLQAGRAITGDDRNPASPRTRPAR
jgi:hypothetical protein